MKPTVLSFGSTRGLWEGDQAEDVQRMLGYAACLERYLVVVHSYRRHRLKPLQLRENFEAIPTDARTAPGSLLRMFRLGVQLLRRHKVSLIQVQDPFALGCLGVVLGKCFQLPVNVCVYGPNVYDEHWLKSHWSHRFAALLGRWVLKHSQAVQVDGMMTERRLRAAGLQAGKIHVKPMVPANLEQFLAIERGAPKAGERVRLLFVGRLVAQKNLSMLLRVIHGLQERVAMPIELLLAGEGPELEPLRALAAKLGIGESVRFCGAVPRDRIVEVFAQADLFVMSSHYEGFARVMMEAAAAALPIVTTAVSGSDEAVVHGRTGYVVPVGALELLTERLGTLVGDAEQRRRMGLAGRDNIRKRLDPSSNTAMQLAIWEHLLGRDCVPA